MRAAQLSRCIFRRRLRADLHNHHFANLVAWKISDGIMADAYCKGVNISLLTFLILATTRSTWHMRQLVRVKKCDSEERRDIYLGALQYVTNIWQLQTMVREHCRQCCSVHCSLGSKCIFLCTIVLFGIWYNAGIVWTCGIWWWNNLTPVINWGGWGRCTNY